MAYSNQVVRRARQQLENAREERQSQTRQRLQTVYTQVPRIREIDRQLRQSMALAAQAAFTQGTDARQAMEQVKQANLSLQQERQALLEANFAPGFLDESPICPHCGGTGYIGSQMCSCLEALCRREQKRELSLFACGQSSFSDFRLDYYPDRVDGKLGVAPRALMERNLSICRKFAQEFGQHSGNLLFVGGTGLGKTMLSACIAGEVAEKGYWVCYESSAHLFSKLEKSRFNPDELTTQQAAGFAECDLLILDDLGTELPGSFVTSALYTLLNDRLMAGKATVISTNLTVDDLSHRYSPQIASRLRGSFRLLPFVGEDIRVLKSR